jgi:hypothetical protein
MSSTPTKYVIVLASVLALFACGQAQEPATEPTADEAPAQETAAPATEGTEAGAAVADEASAAAAGAYAHQLTAGDIDFHWSVDGDQLRIKLVAKTKGWIGIGFNPSSGMKDADFLIGTVKKGEAEVQDHYGTLKTNHKVDVKLGGTVDVSDVSGSEADGTTELVFSIPLDSGDANDSVLDPSAETAVLLAYGKSDVMALKHKAFAILNVTLSTGDHELVRIGP